MRELPIDVYDKISSDLKNWNKVCGIWEWEQWGWKIFLYDSDMILVKDPNYNQEWFKGPLVETLWVALGFQRKCRVDLTSFGSREMSEPDFPFQPIVHGSDGVLRFQDNKLVKYLLDAGPIGLNELALLPGVPERDWDQLAQLIGYSVSAYKGLSYVRQETKDRIPC